MTLSEMIDTALDRSIVLGYGNIGLAARKRTFSPLQYTARRAAPRHQVGGRCPVLLTTAASIAYALTAVACLRSRVLRRWVERCATAGFHDDAPRLLEGGE